MSQFAEIFLAQAKQRSTVKLSIPSYVVVGVRMQFLAVFVQPRLVGVVMGIDIDNLRVPVRLLTRNIVTALEDEDLLACGCQVVSHRSAACPSSNDDYVVTVIAHDA